MVVVVVVVGGKQRKYRGPDLEELKTRGNWRTVTPSKKTALVMGVQNGTSSEEVKYLPNPIPRFLNPRTLM